MRQLPMRLDTVVSEIAMHIAAIKPMALDQSGIDPALIAKEREIAADTGEK